MTVNEWRNKHRKCLFCVHFNNTCWLHWCRAKMKDVYADHPRPFCRLFQLKEWKDNAEK